MHLAFFMWLCLGFGSLLQRDIVEFEWVLDRLGVYTDIDIFILPGLAFGVVSN